MNQHLQNILNIIEQDERLAAEQRGAISKSLIDADKDLEQKSKTVEAQNRELEIESSLERVRTVAMAMIKPDDLLGICKVLFPELQKLGFTQVRNTLITIFNDEKGYFLDYDFSNDTPPTVSTVWYNSNAVIEHFLKLVRSSNDAFAGVVLDGSQLADWKEFRRRSGQPEDPRLDNLAALYYYFYSIGTGAIGISNFQPLTEEQVSILKRFRNVFDLAYRRFLDLQKAEVQAREAQIENALEKVRSRTMAMQRSEELPEAANNLFLQVQSLGIPAWSAGYSIWDEDKKAAECYMSSEGVIQKSFKLPTTGDPTFLNFYEAYKRGETFYVEELGGKALVEHYQFMRTLPVVGEILDGIINAGFPLPVFQIFHVAFFSHGYLLFITYEPVPEAHNIFKRFTNVFEQTYTRFLDLQKAEAQARESQIEAALERVRSKAMAMQKSEDLADAVGIVFDELDKLNLGTLRCGIGIMNREKRSADFWATSVSEKGRAVQVAGDESMDIHPLLSGAFEAWLKQADYNFTLEGEDIIRYYKAVATTNFKLPQSQSISSVSEGQKQYYFLASFPAGALYAFRDSPFPDEAQVVIRRFADVFNLTYTRYNDLQQAEQLAHQAELDLIKLKEEKLRTDRALAELKAAQAQLIQAEKMASLGELTAGIAHEIQNPLNFVNNFSEVSNELIDEMNSEIDKGDMEEAKNLASSIKQNLEKILHHGKRADTIVKGMLQHSRSSTGVKEPTNINVLADEYLRLAFHGLRAKDKTFNASMQTDFDETIGNVNLVPQEIGRVVLNLITNAFYAVSKKKIQASTGFEPLVSVRTKKYPDKIEIAVSDNGDGIPPRVLDKIFQPFFTTKPAGQGTGLGLSLSYDVVKSHNGEIRVKTKEGEGTEFIIELPV